ncbi:unnamed protein product [Brugia pahangi]|uniref:CARD domain-containing protein n=1 Tax=Brugia pahangi TaxID=6280 RepID=A0A0N4TWI4_BRUPA|nr:unnamed protein product [Brugia pahangi]
MRYEDVKNSVLSALSGQIPGHPGISDVLDYLKIDPAMLRILQKYITEKEQLKSSLITRLEEVKRRLE